MDTNLLRTFREVARRGSFTAAGGALRYTQSAVSRQIAALEDEVAASLFDRVPRRGVRLTDAGESLLPHAEAVLERLALAQRDIAALARLEAGHLRVGAFPTANADLMPRALAAFRAQHPNVSPSLLEGTSPRQLARLAAGELHLAVVSADARLPLAADRIELAHLLDEPMLVALPRSHRLATRRSLRLSELAADSWIAGDETVQDPLRTLAPELAERGRIEFVAREWTAKQGLVAAGLGITLVPALAVSTVRSGVALVALHGDDAPARAVYVATATGVEAPPAVGAFVTVLRAVVAELRNELRARGLRLPTRPRERLRLRGQSPQSHDHVRA
jgi:DNA-binding transcriptional LysR family regulator